MTTQLHDLLDAAADSRVPDGLVRSAVADAQRRRRHRFTVAAAVTSAVAVVLTVVAVVEPFTMNADQLVTPAKTVVLPSRLPAPEGLPPLTEAPMDAASAAYVVDGEVVLINAATGEAVRAFASPGDVPPSLSGASLPASGPLHLVHEVDLSPDGRFLLIAGDFGPAADAVGRPLYVLDVISGLIEYVEGAYLSFADGGGWFGPRMIGWAQGSKAFVCICNGGLSRLVAQDGPTDAGKFAVQYQLHIEPFRIAQSGPDTFVQLEPQGNWRSEGWDGKELGRPLTQADLLAFGRGGSYARVQNFFPHSTDGVVLDSSPAWTIEIEDGAPASLPYRPAFREGTAVAVTAAPNGYIVTVRPPKRRPDQPAPLSTLDVALVDPAGNQTALTKLPAGTVSSSFATDAVGP